LICSIVRRMHCPTAVKPGLLDGITTQHVASLMGTDDLYDVRVVDWFAS
jgi:hypothetical protein